MLSERYKPLKGLAPAADRFNTSPSTDVFSMKNLDSITFLVYHDGGTTGKGTFTVEACDDVTPSNTTPVAFNYRRMTTGASDTMGAISAATAAGIDSVPAESTIIEIEVSADVVAETGYTFVRLKCAEAVNDPVNGVVIALGKLRYEGAQPSSVLS